MSKTKKIDLESKIISKIESEEIKMKPKWYFVLGSFFLFASLVGLSMGTAFLINLLVFFLRRNGLFHLHQLQLIFLAFPWWIVIFAVAGVVLAIWILRKYDFSYKKNFALIVTIFVLAILLGGFLLDKLGLNEHLSRGAMRGYYQRFEIYGINNNHSGGGAGKSGRGLNSK